MAGGCRVLQRLGRAEHISRVARRGPGKRELTRRRDHLSVAISAESRRIRNRNFPARDEFLFDGRPDADLESGAFDLARGHGNNDSRGTLGDCRTHGGATRSHDSSYRSNLAER